MKYNVDEAVQLARAADHLWVAKGKRVRHFNLKKDEVTDDELGKVLTGPSGTLRAPVVRRGKKLFVGFEPELYQSQVVG